MAIRFGDLWLNDASKYKISRNKSQYLERKMVRCGKLALRTIDYSTRPFSL